MLRYICNTINVNTMQTKTDRIIEGIKSILSKEVDLEGIYGKYRTQITIHEAFEAIGFDHKAHQNYLTRNGDQYYIKIYNRLRRHIGMKPYVYKGKDKKVRRKKYAKGYVKEKHSQDKIKKEQQNIWYNIIQESGEYGKILDLPCSKPDFEEKLLNISNKFSFDFYEFNTNSFIKLTKNVKKSPIVANVYLGPILNGIDKASEDEYSHAMLDYCGAFTSFKKDIEQTIVRNIVRKNGTILMTFSKRSKKELDPFLMHFKENISVVSQCARFLKECIDKSDGEYQLAYKPQEYRNNNHNMFSIFLKRIK